MSDPVPPPKKRGCLFYGCLGGTFCLLAILVAFLFGLYQVKKMLNFYTDAQPMSLPSVHFTQEQLDQVKQRVAEFTDAARTGRPAQPLELTSDELNAYIEADPNLARLKGKVYVGLEGDELKAQMSMPLSEIGLPFFRNRYLNGKGTFSVFLRDGNLVVTADSIEVKGKPLPSVYMDKIHSQNLADSLANNPRASVAISHLQDVKVSDSKLIITPKVEQ